MSFLGGDFFASRVVIIYYKLFFIDCQSVSCSFCPKTGIFSGFFSCEFYTKGNLRKNGGAFPRPGGRLTSAIKCAILSKERTPPVRAAKEVEK